VKIIWIVQKGYSEEVSIPICSQNLYKNRSAFGKLKAGNQFKKYILAQLEAFIIILKRSISKDFRARSKSYRDAKHEAKSTAILLFS